MMIKKKPCSGQDQAQGFQGCGKLVNVEHRKFGLGKMCCFPKWLTTTEPGKLYMNRVMRIVKKKTEKENPVIKPFDKVQHKKDRDAIKDWSKELQVKVNLIVRLIDKGLPCLARNYFPKKYDAGHVYARGGNQTIRFNLHNIHRQSAQSNHFQNDDGLLREGLTKEYGQEYMNFVSELRRTPQLHISNPEFHELYKKASKIALRLKKSDNEYVLEDRIRLRNSINKELGIYDNEFCHFGPLN